MDDLISRQAAIDAIGEKSDEIYKTKQKGATYPHDDFFQGMAYAENVVKQLSIGGKKRCNSQQAINLLNVLEQRLDDYCELNNEGKAAFRMAITALELFGNAEQLPSAQPEQRWIPCSERLPEPRIDVWCNSDMGQMVGYYEENAETWYGIDYLELMVTAWMPLPEPRRGGESDHEFRNT